MSLCLGDSYTDRFLVYIDNSIEDFELNPSNGKTNHGEINQKLEDLNALNMHQWLSNARPTDRDGDIFLNRYYVVQFESSRTDLLALVKDMAQLESIRTAEMMTINRPTYIPNDPRWNQQYFLPLIEADLAYDIWDIDGGEVPGHVEDGEIVIGIVDDAIDWDHPDLINNLWQNLDEDADGDGSVLEYVGGSWQFDSGDENGVDDDGDGYVDNFIGWDMADGDNDPMYTTTALSHGTSVAGSATAQTNNGSGVASVGWSVKFMPFRCSESGTYISYGYNGILAAAQMGAQVINCSWGGFGGGNQSVINNVVNNYGCVVVASAGNGDSNGNTNFDYHTPSGLNDVISVSATGPNDNFGCWATGGETVDLCAPGDGIWTTSLGGGYGQSWGTSFSSPITAGAAALLWSRFPDSDNEWIVDRIITTTDEFSDMTGSCNGNSLEGMLGSGRLNIFKALSAGIFPSLTIEEMNFQNDDDGDGVFNPGEQVKLKLVIANGEGWADAENVVCTIESNDERIAILDNSISFDNPIPAGGSSFTLIDHFLLYAHNDAALGNAACTVTITAGTSEPFYEVQIPIDIEISLNQFGFPISGITIKSSPLIADLDGNSLNEIYFGADDDTFYGYQIAGLELSGFPIDANDNIRSSPAGGDIDGDGDKEIVFGSNDGKLYAVNTNGTSVLTFTQSGDIVGAPALGNFDSDDELEIIFTTSNSSSSNVYGINGDGTDLDGFPISIGEKMLVGAALGDLEQDGSLDIVVVTWEDNIHAFNADGSTKNGFPVETGERFNSPPTLVDLDNDGDLEIVAGNDDGELYCLDHDGSIMAYFSTGDDIRGGISVADLNSDGSLEILLAGYDDHLHVWNPESNAELDGFPIDLGYNSLSSPLTVDLDDDGDLEIVACMKQGNVFVFHHDGSNFTSFPTSVAGNIESTPAVGDLDNDGDYEIVIGTTQGLQVFDIKSNKGEMFSWKLHRGNETRTGYFDNLTLASLDDGASVTPTEFLVSPNYPNPFNPVTHVDIALPESGKLIVSIFDLSGRLINTLIDDNLEAGSYSVTWHGNNQMGQFMPTGIYFMKIISGANMKTQKLALIK